MSAKKMCQRWSVLLHFVQFFNIKKKKNVVKKQLCSPIMQLCWVIMIHNPLPDGGFQSMKPSVYICVMRR